MNDQEDIREKFKESLSSFQKKYDLPKVGPIVQRLDSLEQEYQTIFERGMKYREEGEQARIIAYFYNAKVEPIAKNLNEALNELAEVHTAALAEEREAAQKAALQPQKQIPQGMALLTWLMTGLFAAMALLILRMLVIRRRNVAERDRLYEEAKNANLVRDEMLAAISEDLKEPLREIRQIAASLPQTENGSELKEKAEQIHTEATLVEDRMNDIRDQGKANMDMMTLRLDQMGVDEVLEEARLMLQPLAKARDVRLHTDTMNASTLAFFDRERVLRVLANLIGNAIKFSPRHSKVNVKARTDQAFVHISITDSGPGIPEKQIAGIFDKFWQAPKTADQGAGVGLAVVKTVIEAHGGTVGVTSHPGQGSTFSFSLPRRRPVGAQISRPATPVVKKAARPRSNEAPAAEA